MGEVRTAVESDFKSKLKEISADIEGAMSVKEKDLEKEKGQEKRNKKSIATLTKAKKHVDAALKELENY